MKTRSQNQSKETRKELENSNVKERRQTRNLHASEPSTRPLEAGTETVGLDSSVESTPIEDETTADDNRVSLRLDSVLLGLDETGVNRMACPRRTGSEGGRGIKAGKSERSINASSAERQGVSEL